MADKGTEQATPQRKKKAREQGDIVHSRELLSAMAMLGGVITLGAMSNGFVSTWGKVYVESLRSAMASVKGQGGELLLNDAVRRILLPTLLPIGLVMAASFTGALVSGVAQSGGVQIYPKSVELKFSKLNPVTNLGNLFSLRSTTRVVKSLVPAAVMVVLGWAALKALMIPMPVMSLMRLPATFSAAYGLALDAAWVTLAWSGLDYAIEWRSWNQRLKMSKQEMREEMRDAMGNPQIKAKVRQIQRDAQAQGEGGHVAGERGDYEPDTLCGGAGVQLRDDVGSDGAGQGTRSAGSGDSRGGTMGRGSDY